jgi:Voltage-dependent anion channel
MGSGIVSIALLLDGRATLSVILLVFTATIWVAVARLLSARAVADWSRFRRETRDPAALTAVAGTAMLGTRLTLVGWGWAGVGLLIVASTIWVALLPRVLSHWHTPTNGTSFIATVATESLALLASTLALSEHAAWLVCASMFPFALGLGLYVLTLSRFDWRQLAVARGDHWVGGGALAISTLAAGHIVLAADATGALPVSHGAVNPILLALWCLAMLWLPVLLATEVIYPRLEYAARRWSTAFPVGMYAACSFVVGTVTHTHAITDFAEVWVWVAFAVWLITFTALVARGLRLTHAKP